MLDWLSSALCDDAIKDVAERWRKRIEQSESAGEHSWPQMHKALRDDFRLLCSDEQDIQSILHNAERAFDEWPQHEQHQGAWIVVQQFSSLILSFCEGIEAKNAPLLELKSYAWFLQKLAEIERDVLCKRDEAHIRHWYQLLFPKHQVDELELEGLKVRIHSALMWGALASLLVRISYAGPNVSFASPITLGDCLPEIGKNGSLNLTSDVAINRLRQTMAVQSNEDLAAAMGITRKTLTRIRKGDGAILKVKHLQAMTDIEEDPLPIAAPVVVLVNIWTRVQIQLHEEGPVTMEEMVCAFSEFKKFETRMFHLYKGFKASGRVEPLLTSNQRT